MWAEASWEEQVKGIQGKEVADEAAEDGSKSLGLKLQKGLWTHFTYAVKPVKGFNVSGCCVETRPQEGKSEGRPVGKCFHAPRWQA